MKNLGQKAWQVRSISADSVPNGYFGCKAVYFSNKSEVVSVQVGHSGSWRLPEMPPAAPAGKDSLGTSHPLKHRREEQPSLWRGWHSTRGFVCPPQELPRPSGPWATDSPGCVQQLPKAALPAAPGKRRRFWDPAAPEAPLCRRLRSPASARANTFPPPLPGSPPAAGDPGGFFQWLFSFCLRQPCFSAGRKAPFVGRSCISKVHCWPVMNLHAFTNVWKQENSFAF